jgi:hypothetical protein
VTVFQFGPENRRLPFDYFDLKITTMVSWFGPQNYVGFSLSVVPQNRQREDDAGHSSRSSRLLHLEVSRARVSQSDHKTGGDATTGDAHGIIVEVTLRES